MTDRPDNIVPGAEEGTEQVTTNAGFNSRRAMLRSAAPMIVTLYSGAALAQSSNLISVDSTPGAEAGKYRCLETTGLGQYGNKYDLGREPLGHVTQIQSQKQYYQPKYSGERSNEIASAPQMCSKGGYYYRKDTTTKYTKVSVKKGVLVSSTALNSFSSGIRYTDV